MSTNAIKAIKRAIKWILPTPLRVFEWGMGRMISAQGELRKQIGDLSSALQDDRSRTRDLLEEWKNGQQGIQTLSTQFQENRQALHSLKVQIEESAAGVRKEKSRWLSPADQARLAEFNEALQSQVHPVASLVRASEPKILSVLIPARAAGEYIGECLDSILRQPIPDGMGLEVLVGVDGCESTRTAVLRYRDKASLDDARKIRCHFFPGWCGPYVILNSLLSVSRGLYAHVVGADDALAPGVLTPLWRFAEQCRTCSPIFIIRPMGLFCDEKLLPIPGRTAWPLKGALFFPKSAIERLGGFAPWLCAADTDFLRRAEAAGLPIYAMPQATYLYRRHGVQLTQGGQTGMKSGMRAYYWRLTDSRLVRAALREQPVVAESDGDDGSGDPMSADRSASGRDERM